MVGERLKVVGTFKEGLDPPHKFEHQQESVKSRGYKCVQIDIDRMDGWIDGQNLDGEEE